MNKFYLRENLLNKLILLAMMCLSLPIIICSCKANKSITSVPLVSTVMNSEEKESNSDEGLSESEEIIESEVESDAISESIKESEIETDVTSDPKESDIAQESEIETESETFLESEKETESEPIKESEVESEIESETLYESETETEIEEEKFFTVVFITEGNEEFDSQNIPEGDFVEMPQAPKKEGYAFLGWYLNGEIFDFTKPITSSLELVATWEAYKPIDELVGTWKGDLKEDDGNKRTIVILSNGTGTFEMYVTAISYGTCYIIAEITYYGNLVKMTYIYDGVTRVLYCNVVGETMVCNDIFIGGEVVWVKED